ncbi:MAG: AzlC family ABC transporter permease [Thermoflavifilum sp.]|nr:AzlC family ABC transporter permease [Thermoflavifilum sp.]MCL6514987.1 AzlC family ABC transporter permease [Alicyclobacillus sp.]
MMAYVPIAMTFGVLCVSHGLPWLLTVFISVWVYAGGAQFMLVGLAMSGASMLSTVITVLLVNLRHVLYGTALGPSFAAWREPAKWLFAFGMTDEVFAVSSGRGFAEPPVPWRQIPFALACYASWVGGTVVGGWIGQVVPSSVAEVLGFALPALFIALLALGPRSLPHLAAAMLGAAVAICAHLLQLGNLAVIVGALAGAAGGWGWETWRDRHRGGDEASSSPHDTHP